MYHQHITAAFVIALIDLDGLWRRKARKVQIGSIPVLPINNTVTSKAQNTFQKKQDGNRADTYLNLKQALVTIHRSPEQALILGNSSSDSSSFFFEKR